MSPHAPHRIHLDEARRAALVDRSRSFFMDTFDQELSEWQAERLIAFFVEHLGAPVYNQAVQDARRYVIERLDDLEGDIHEPEAT